MGDPSLEWEFVDYYPCVEEEEDELECGKSKLIGWIMNRGVSLGRKLVITGAVMSSVPLVLPPLVVISALGFAFSVPFGVVFASYACTEKLMSKLLPSPPLLEYQTELDDEEKEQRQESIQTRMESVDYEENNGTDSNPELLNINVEAGPETHSYEIKPSLTNGVDSTGIGATAANSNEGQNNVDTSEKDSESTVPIVQPHPQNVTDSEEIRDKFVQAGKTETLTGIEGTVKDKERPTLSKGSKGRKKNHVKKKDKESQGESRTSSAKNLDLGGKSCPEVLVVQESSKDDLGSVSSEKEKQEKPVAEQSPLIVSNRPGDNYNQSRISDSEVAALTKLKHDEGIPGITEQKNAGAGHSLVANEAQLPDEKIWKKLDAIRVIVGFKAARHPSYFEELKALYLFTGIEPPSSSMGDPSDLKEFHDRLCFLMSVIGLK